MLILRYILCFFTKEGDTMKKQLIIALLLVSNCFAAYNQAPNNYRAYHQKRKRRKKKKNHLKRQIRKDEHKLHKMEENMHHSEKHNMHRGQGRMRNNMHRGQGQMRNTNRQKDRNFN